MMSSSPFSEINQLIQAGQLNEAESTLAKFSPQSRVEHRISGHLLGVVRVRQGRLVEARTQLEKTRVEYGENVKLLRDLACCYQEMHEMHLFRSAQTNLESALQQNWSRLSFSSRFNVQLAVAKFKEEDGRVAQALHIYRQLLDLSDRQNQKGLREMILAQLVRAQALYDPVAPLNSHYSELMAFSSEDHSLEVNIEVEHSLMLAELVLVGPEHAWARAAQIFAQPDVIDADRRLIYYDFLESCLVSGYKIPKTAALAKEDFAACDLFEKHIKALAFQGVASISLVDMSRLASRLSWSSFMRLLCVVANLHSEDFQRLEIHKKIAILLGSLDEESQRMWRKRLKQVFQAPETKLEFSALRRALYYGSSSVDLSRKKGMLQLLEHLSNSQIITIDEVIGLLWQSDFSPEHYHRLRMMVHRLNRLVNEFTSLDKILEVDSESVRLKPGIRIVMQKVPGEIAQDLSS